ncbi:MAG: glycosyltransferase family 4 protein [Candidatus Daviesbacteria bacterium]|nr:MAG: glycosyltransferase family 4 protein [Candidatus Daviesbacteria bacterium]
MVAGFDGSRAFVKNRTGTENYSYQLLKNLAKIDQKNQYVVYLRPGNEVKEKWPSNFEFKVLNYPRLWTQIGLAKQTFQDKLDVLFVPAHTLPIVRRPGLKTVVTVHDLGSEFLPKTHQIKQRLYLSFMQQVQLKGATKLIAVSKATKNDLVQKIGLDPKKIEVVYEGFDKNLFKPVKNLSRATYPELYRRKSRDDALVNSLKQFGLRPKEYFLFVGTIQPRKNLERLIKAFGLIARRPVATQPRSAPPLTTRLVLVGSKGWLSEEIYELPRKLGIEKQVKFLGRVDDEDLPALYSGAIALVFPSLFEGFGLPILEAQACQVPVITSNLSSMPEVAGPPASGGAILVDPYSEKEIANAMIKVINPKVRADLIKKGLQNLKRFSWEKCARETLKVLLSS